MSGDKLLLFDWLCECCNKTHEALEYSSKKIRTCPNCQAPDAKRQLSTPRFDIRMGCDPTGNPTMAAKWARQHEQAKRIEEKRARDNGPDADGSAGADIRR